MELKWKIKDVLKAVWNSIVAIVKGNFLTRLHMQNYFMHILYTFFLFGMLIWISLMIDTTLNRVEKNRRAIRELEILHSQKTYEMVSLSRRSTVAAMLSDMGSAVGEPDRPATKLEK